MKYIKYLLPIIVLGLFSLQNAFALDDSNVYVPNEIYVNLSNEFNFPNDRFLDIDSVPVLSEIQEEYGIFQIENHLFFVDDISDELKNSLRVKFSDVRKTEELISFLNNEDDVDFAEKIPKNYESEDLNNEDLCFIKYSKLIRYGRVGEDVRQTQECLNSLGYDTGIADGIYGPKTYAGIREFQISQNIKVDGIVGPQTIQYLNAQ